MRYKDNFEEKPDTIQQLLYSDKFVINSVLENKYKTIGGFLMGFLITLFYFSSTCVGLAILINAIESWFKNPNVWGSSSTIVDLIGFIFVGLWCLIFSMLSFRMIQKLYSVFRNKHKSFKLKIFLILIVPTATYIVLMYFVLQLISQMEISF